VWLAGNSLLLEEKGILTFQVTHQIKALASTLSRHGAFLMDQAKVLKAEAVVDASFKFLKITVSI